MTLRAIIDENTPFYRGNADSIYLLRHKHHLYWYILWQLPMCAVLMEFDNGINHITSIIQIRSFSQKYSE